jgi:tetratricopeptide (TPR) repeat protein
MAVKNAYSILNVKKEASEEEIKRAYVQMVKRFDPERHTEHFMLIQRAYESLRDPRRRAHEDVFTFNLVTGQFSYSSPEREAEEDETLDPKIEQATQRAQAAPAGDPIRAELVDLLMKRSWQRVKKRLWSGAVSDWEELLKVDPAHHRAKNNLTYALIQLAYSYALHGLYDEAAANWERSLRLNPDNHAVIHNLALAYEQSGAKDKAAKYWAEALKKWRRDLDKDPDDPYLKERVMEVHKFQGEQALNQVDDNKAAIREYREVLKIAPDDFRAQFQMATGLMNDKNFTAAIEALRALQRKHPKNIETLNLLGWAYLNSNDHDRAFQAWRRSQALEPDNKETRENIIKARMQLAASLRERQQFTYALVHYKELQRLIPDSEEVQLEIAQTFKMRGDKRSAEREFRRVMQINPKNKTALKALSELRLGA